MTRQEILNSRDALKRFCRDFNVPAATLDNFYFEKQLQTLSMYYPHYADLFDEYVDELSNFVSIESYFEHYNSLKEAVISSNTSYELKYNVEVEKRLMGMKLVIKR